PSHLYTIALHDALPIFTALLAEYEEINEKFGLPEIYEDADAMEKLMARQGELQDRIDATGAWELDSKLERAMDALRCPDPETKIDRKSTRLNSSHVKIS